MKYVTINNAQHIKGTMIDHILMKEVLFYYRIPYVLWMQADLKKINLLENV